MSNEYLIFFHFYLLVYDIYFIRGDHKLLCDDLAQKIHLLYISWIEDTEGILLIGTDP